MSLSTSSSSASWRRCFLWFVGSAGALGLALYGWVLVVDPFDTLALSPHLDRVPVDTNARFSFPAIARDARFDSIVAGTSTARMLEPAKLNAAIGGRFANLAMNSATAYEQHRIVDLFRRSHPNARAVLIGADGSWCVSDDQFTRYTFRPFPEWMYDDDPWNDYLHHFNFHSIEQTGRQFEALLGWRPPRQGLDGYRNFLPDNSEYDLERARGHIWGNGPRRHEPVVPPVRFTEAERRALSFPALALLEQTLAAFPEETLKVVFFVPYHVATQGPPGSQTRAQHDECKARVAALAAGIANAHVVDFMIDSPITAVDANYWDPLHYRVEVADMLPPLLGAAISDPAPSPFYRRLTRAPAAARRPAADGTLDARWPAPAPQDMVP